MVDLKAKRSVELTESEWVDVMRALNGAGHSNMSTSYECKGIRKEFYEKEAEKFFRLAQKVMEREDKTNE